MQSGSAAMPLTNRRAMITGASRGFGLAVAQTFLEQGASLLICARQPSVLSQAAKKLKPFVQPQQQLFAVAADVSRAAEVKRLAAFALKKLGRVEILVNNAGVYGPKGSVESVSSREWQQAVAINLFGTFLMSRQMLPHFKQHHYGKIINLSGGGATAPLPYLSAYAASKTAVVRLTETMAQECLGSGIDINAVAPGPLNTRLLDEVLEAGPEKVGQAFYAKALEQKKTGGAPLEKGAALCAYLGSAASDGISGRLLSAIWDPWESLAGHKDELQVSDVYTLRRIVPQDRKLNWGGPK